jgi:predicted DsbA family dithiol-disulfide isomerase
MITLDLFSDPICPWCYIGKTHLFRALEAAGDNPFVLTWHPFQLNPDMPPEGMDRRAYLEGKFGGKQAAIRAYAPIAETAEAMGLKLNLEAITRTPNTLDAHRMIHWAGLEHKQTPMAQALFEAYFVKGEDIGDHDALVEIGTRAGLEADMTTRLLAGDADAGAIRERDAHARARGISAVPTFIIANQHVVPGAQPPELWAQVIAELAAAQKSADAPQ